MKSLSRTGKWLIFPTKANYAKSLFLLSLLSLSLGELSLGEILERPLAWNPLIEERLPRLFVLLCSGASLAIGGALTQSLFQNPLASPSILGISCGGSLAILIALLFSLHLTIPFAIPLSSFAGALATLFLVYSLAKLSRGGLHQLILTGIALSTLFVAIHEAIVYAERDNWALIQTLTEWEAGSSVDRSWTHVRMQLPLAILGFFGAFRYRRELDLLALGEEEALHLGVDVTKVRWHLFLSVACLTSSALSAIGSIPFFGLVLPHIVRKMFGSSHQVLIKELFWIGGGSLLFLDTFLRFFHIHELSLGSVSAVLGGLFFLYLLFQPERFYARN